MKNKELLKIARERFDADAGAEKHNREAFSRDVAFEHGHQWSDEEKKLRSGRPCLTINKVAGAVKQIIGEARRNRPRIKVRPVDTGADPATATLLTGLIRNIESVCNAEAAYDSGFENAVRGGFGYWRVLTDYVDDAAFDQEIRIERIVDPESVYMDQSSIQPDYSDADHGFIIASVPLKKFKKEYPKANIAGWDDPDEKDSGWFDEESIRVAEYFYKEPYTKHVFELADGRTVEVEEPQIQEQWVPVEGGAVEMKVVSGTDFPPTEFVRDKKVKAKKVKWVKMTGTEVLEGPKDWPGKYIPIIPCLGEEVWIDGKRYLRSAIYHSHDAQKLYNWARSNTVETLAQAPKQPYIVTPDEVAGHEKQWQESHIKPQSYRLFNEVGLGRPQPSSPSIPNTGAYREAMVSSDDIKSTTSVYDASLGAQGNETSGLAIERRQEQGSTAAFVFADNQAKAIKYTGKVLVDLIPKIYDTERVIRLLNDDGKEAWAQINILDPATGDVVANDLTIGRYDVVVDAGPGYETMRQEAADGYTKLAQTAPQYANILIPEIAKNLDWPGADKISKSMEAMNQPQEPSPAEQIEMQKSQLELQKQELEVEAKRIDNIGKELEVEKKRLEIIQGRSESDAKIRQTETKTASDVMKAINQPLRGASTA